MSEEQAKIVEIKEGLSDANHELIYITDMFKEHVIHDWMERLLAEIDRLQDELQSAQQEIGRIQKDSGERMQAFWELTDLHKATLDREQKLIEGLKWYTNHTVAHVLDNGKRAKATLKELGVTE